MSSITNSGLFFYLRKQGIIPDECDKGIGCVGGVFPLAPDQTHPLIVSIDPDGRNLFEEQKVLYNQRKEAAKQAIYPEVKFIK